MVGAGERIYMDYTGRMSNWYINRLTGEKAQLIASWWNWVELLRPDGTTFRVLSSTRDGRIYKAYEWMENWTKLA